MATIKGFSSDLAKTIKEIFNIIKEDDKYYNLYRDILKCAIWGDSDYECYTNSMSEYLEIRQNLLANGFKVEKLDYMDDDIYTYFIISW